jgi:hypothetical protein
LWHSRCWPSYLQLAMSRASSAVGTRLSDSNPRRARWRRATHWPDPRRLRGQRRSPDRPAQGDGGRKARSRSAADLRARRLDFRRSRLQAEGDDVALPDRRVLARLNVGQGRPAAPADPARDEAVRIAAARTRRGRAHLRPLEEERVRPCTAFVDLSGSRSTPTWRCAPGSGRLLHEREPFRSRRNR